MVQDRSVSNRSRSGHAVIEVAFMAPWIFFLFVGVLDFGFFAHALISVENATRAAALQTSTATDGSSNNQQIACQAVLPELNSMPNASGFDSACSTGDLVVAVSAVNGPDSTGGVNVPASQVTVTYNTIPMVPIPGILMGKYKFARSVTMRVQ